MLSFAPAARAETPENPQESAWSAPVLRAESATANLLLDAPRPLLATQAQLPSPAPTTDLALSKGAKIAIIVGAIVVGVIIIFGVASIGHHGP